MPVRHKKAYPIAKKTTHVDNKAYANIQLALVARPIDTHAHTHGHTLTHTCGRLQLSTLVSILLGH